MSFENSIGNGKFNRPNIAPSLSAAAHTRLSSFAKRYEEVETFESKIEKMDSNELEILLLIITFGTQKKTIGEVLTYLIDHESSINKNLNIEGLKVEKLIDIVRQTGVFYRSADLVESKVVTISLDQKDIILARFVPTDSKNYKKRLDNWRKEFKVRYGLASETRV